VKRLLLIILVVLIAVPAGAVTAAHFLLNGDSVRARVADAVRRATGRELTIAGPVQLAWSLTPTIEAEDVNLLNPPGMSRPATAHLDRVEAQVALLPLLARRVEVRRVVLIGPDILLERDVQGRANWLLARPEAPAPSAQPSAPSGDKRFTVAVGEVEIRDALVAWRSASGSVAARAPRVAYAPETGKVDGQLAVNGVPLALGGTAGPFAGGAWPLHLQLAGGGMTATLAGTAAQAQATVLTPDLAALGQLVGRTLPAIRDVRLEATLSTAGLTGLQLQAGRSELGGEVLLSKLSASAPALAEPVTAEVELRVRALPVALKAKAGSLAALLGRGPIPLAAIAAIGDATLSAWGTVADLRGGGAELAISAGAPDLARLGALAGVAVPPLRDVSLDVNVASAPAGLLLRGLRLNSAQGDLAGDLAAGLQPRPSLRGSLVSRRLELDAWAPRPPPPSPAPEPAPAPTQAGPAPAPPAPDRVIPDHPLPFPALRQADADLHASVGEAVWRGATFRALDLRLVLQDGRLRLEPVTAEAAGGPIHAELLADAGAQPPTLALTAKGSGLAAGPVLAWLGAPETTKGTLDLDLKLRGQGATTRALAATLDGHLGLAVIDGQVENRWLEELFAGALRAANLPIEAGGVSRVRCAALRADASAGQVRLRALTLDTTRLKLDGEGSLNLAAETLDLHLKPRLRLGGGLSVPVHVGGTFRAPKVALDPGAIAPGRVGITLGGPAPADTCGSALLLARDGQAGPGPSTPEPPSRPARPADLLRGLLR